MSDNQAILDDPSLEDAPKITEVFVIEDTENPELLTPSEMAERDKQKLPPDAAKFLDDLQAVATKSVQGTRQTLVRAVEESRYYDLSGEEVVQAPYDADMMLMYSQSDEVVHTCVRAKSHDATSRGFELALAPHRLNEDVTEDSDAFREDVAKVRQFLNTANEDRPFFDVLKRVAMDVEAIGWGALEVIRSKDGEVQRVDHIPASRIRPLKGLRGFKEITGESLKEVFYQPFGDKFLSQSRVGPRALPERYNPKYDRTEAGPEKPVPNYIDAESGQPTKDFAKSANEVIWLVKDHPATTYYGMTDTVAAMAHVLGNMHIRQFFLQFFEHNTVPRYAVIIRGATIEADVKTEIVKFFQTQIKGRPHKTLILPLMGNKSEIEVEFKRLDSDPKDGWFKTSEAAGSHAIRIAHGVPAAVAGFSDAASLGSGKGLSQAEIYKDRVVGPLQGVYTSVVNRLILEGLFVINVVIKFDQLDVRDREALARTLTMYEDRGILSINEVRADLGKPAIKGGDRHFIKLGNAIIFVDEIEKLNSGPTATANPDNEPPPKVLPMLEEQRGGDRTESDPEDPESPVMTDQRAANATLNPE